MTASLVGVAALVLTLVWAMVTNSRLIRARNTVYEAQRLLEMELERPEGEGHPEEARSAYEAAVRSYNRRIRIFPNRLVAGRYFRPV